MKSYKITTSLLKIINKVQTSVIKGLCSTMIEYSLDEYKDYQQVTREEEIKSVIKKIDDFAETKLAVEEQEFLSQNITDKLVKTKKKLDKYGCQQSEIVTVEKNINNLLLAYVEQKKGELVFTVKEDKQEQLERLVNNTLEGSNTTSRLVKEIKKISCTEEEKKVFVETINYVNELTLFYNTAKKLFKGFYYDKEAPQETVAVEITSNIGISSFIQELYPHTNLYEYTDEGVTQFYKILDELNTMQREKMLLDNELYQEKTSVKKLCDNTVLEQGSTLYVPATNAAHVRPNHGKIKGDTHVKG